MHWIQRHIIKQLAFSDNLRYTELKPDNVEGNLFQYHARVLEKQGLIKRSGEGYELTSLGSSFVADLSQTKAMNRKIPPRVVIMVYAKNSHGELLMFRWRRHPYRGLVSLPFGRQLKGQSSAWVAVDQLKWKTGYETDMAYIGLVSLKMANDHLLIQVFEASELRGEHGSDGLTGYSFWMKPESLLEYEIMPGTAEILTWIADPNHSELLELDL